MAFGAIDLTTVSRAQDYSPIKQNEDNKGQIIQSNGQQQVDKNETQKNREVHSGEDTRWAQHNPDARNKGNGEYAGDGGQKRKKPKDRVVVKGKPSGFDIKV